MLEQFHKVEAVAPCVGMSQWALYQAIRAGQFPHVKIGNRIRIPEGALQRWIEEQLAKNTKAQQSETSLAATV